MDSCKPKHVADIFF